MLRCWCLSNFLFNKYNDIPHVTINVDILTSKLKHIYIYYIFNLHHHSSIKISKCAISLIPPFLIRCNLALNPPFKENALFLNPPLLSPYIPVSGKSVAFWITSYSPYYGKWSYYALMTPRPSQGREG